MLHRLPTAYALACVLLLGCSTGPTDGDGGRADAASEAGPDATAPGPDGSPQDAEADRTGPGPEDASADGGSPDGAPGGFRCPSGGVRGPGRHRLFVQGREAPPLPNGRWPLLHVWRDDGGDAELCDDTVFVDDANGNGRWDPGEEPRPLGPPGIVHGEHFLVGAGSYAEFEAVLCDDITGSVVLYIPNFDQEGSEALHELLVVHPEDGDREEVIATAVDDEPGFSGYNPFVRVLEGEDPAAHPGDLLVLRSTNLSGVAFSVMVWRPPSEYESWVVVEVPDASSGG